MPPILREDVHESRRVIILIEEILIIGKVVRIHSWLVEFEVLGNRFRVGTVLLATNDDGEVR